MSFKWWLVTATSLFAIGLGFGLASTIQLEGLPAEELARLKELADLLAPLPQSSLFIFILFKNIFAVMFSLVLSPLLFVVPVLALLFNGWLIGLFSILVVEEKSLAFLLAGLLPHGIIELPALFIGEAAALSFGAGIMRSVWKGDGLKLGQNFRQVSRLVALCFALFLAAAFVEAFVTPRVLIWVT
ncbi:MAG: stage II sporulation protein M [Chloroflexi bacterium]|nr:stage II sporulation protein M [Chloroflexota bacterium]